MQTLYSSPQTRRTIEQGIANNKIILWIYDSSKSLFFNPTITSGSIAGATVTPSDGGAALGPDFIVKGGVDGFASAARKAGLYQGNGLSSEFEDNAAAQIFFAGATFVHGSAFRG